MLYIILDTNIIVQDYRMSGSKFESLFKSISLYNFRLQVPDVVVDEVINKYRSELRKHINNSGKSIKALNRLTDSDFADVKIEVDAEVNKYREFLIGKVNDLGGDILPYPGSDNKVTVTHILNRVHPFQGGEKGFRDYLILKSLVPAEINSRDRFIFVTDNNSDFGSEPYFFDDIYEHHFPDDSRQVFLSPEIRTFEVRNSLRSLNNEFFEKALEKIPFNDKQLKYFGLDSFDFMAYFQENLKDSINSYGIGFDLFGISINSGSIYFRELVHIHSYEITSITELLKPKLLIEYIISLNGIFEMAFGYEDFLQDEGVRELFGFDEEEEPFASVMMNQEAELSIKGKIIFDLGNMHIIANELSY